MKITKEEQRVLHPHKFYGLKCGMPINYIGTTYLFMGYADKGLWVLADKYGNRFNVPRMY